MLYNDQYLWSHNIESTITANNEREIILTFVTVAWGIVTAYSYSFVLQHTDFLHCTISHYGLQFSLALQLC